jgi:hypothetical protein
MKHKEKSMNVSVVSPEEFIANERYAKYFGKNMFPVWKDDLVKLQRSGSNLAIVGGATGSGKSFFVYLSSAYDLYKVCQMQANGGTGLLHGSMLTFVLAHVDSHIAECMMFKPFSQILHRIPFFVEHGIKVDSSSITLPGFGIEIVFVSGNSAARSLLAGKNVIGGIIDGYDTDQHWTTLMLDDIQTRIMSRFIHPVAKIYWIQKTKPDCHYGESRIDFEEPLATEKGSNVICLPEFLNYNDMVICSRECFAGKENASVSCGHEGETFNPYSNRWSFL